MALTPDNEVPFPENIHAYVNTTLAWDKIDRLEETFSGAGTNGIAIQARYFGANLPPAPEILAEARKKNLPWILVRLHSKEKPARGSGLTGFNFSVRNKVEVSQNVIRYLPTIDALASDMATVHEVMVQSLKINRIRSSLRASFSSLIKDCMQRQLRSSADKVRNSKISC